ncbi:glycosyltransferase family 2 protein [bacterium]|nr:glycosyltransferase family 2 protein [bacterium]
MNTPQTSSSIAVVVSAYNESAVIAGVLQEILNLGHQVVVVDDGSRDATYEICTKLPVHLLRHPINLGAGAAFQTGIEYAVTLPGVEAIVSMDGDGQHLASEIAPLAAPVIAGEVEVALGSRFMGIASERMPKSKRLLLLMAAWFTRLTTGVSASDPHNGMRAMSRRAASNIHLTQNGYAFCSEIIYWLGHSGLSWREVPIKVRYTDYSMSKGQSMLNMFNILLDLLFR